MNYYSFRKYILDVKGLDILNCTLEEIKGLYYSYEYLYIKKCCELQTVIIDNLNFFNKLEIIDNRFKL